ncbi:MAG: ATP-dependent sacrificial sulfur transferase LarE [Actinobacteria bacterium]|nr:ATP-dependent sacrificial sulfur transferase LarE [Actinomycetota bacterium]
MRGDLSVKRSLLRDSLVGLGDVVVAYSGGVDSALVAASAHEALGEHSLALTAVSPSLARRELDAARSLARANGWNHSIVSTREVAREEYAQNNPDRCYWCKTELFEVLEPIAEQRGATIVVGTNCDDLGDHRPGLEAAREHDVRAPLVDAGLTKADVRALSAELGLPTADKPASPCLASRFAYGVRVTPEGLRRVDRAEELVRSFGFEVLRVRDHGDLARIELPPEDIAKAAGLGPAISEGLRGLGFSYVALDLGGFRSGSLNAVLGAPKIGVPPPPLTCQ